MEAKTASKNLLEKIWILSQSSSVNEFQEVISIFFSQLVSEGYLNLLSKAKYHKETAPPMAAAGLLGPDLVMSFVVGTALRVLCPAQKEEMPHDGKGGQ